MMTQMRRCTRVEHLGLLTGTHLTLMRRCSPLRGESTLSTRVGRGGMVSEHLGRGLRRRRCRMTAPLGFDYSTALRLIRPAVADRLGIAYLGVGRCASLQTGSL